LLSLATLFVAAQALFLSADDCVAAQDEAPAAPAAAPGVDAKSAEVLSKMGKFYQGLYHIQTSVTSQASGNNGKFKNIAASVEQAVKNGQLNPAMLQMLPPQVLKFLEQQLAADAKLQGKYQIGITRSSEKLAIRGVSGTYGDEVVADTKQLYHFDKVSNEYTLRDTPGLAKILEDSEIRSRVPLMELFGMIFHEKAEEALLNPKGYATVTYVGEERLKGTYWHHLKFSAANRSLHLYVDSGPEPLIRKAEFEGFGIPMFLAVSAFQVGPNGQPQNVFNAADQAQAKHKVVYDFGPWNTKSPVPAAMFQIRPVAKSKQVEQFSGPSPFGLEGPDLQALQGLPGVQILNGQNGQNVPPGVFPPGALPPGVNPADILKQFQQQVPPQK